MDYRLRPYFVYAAVVLPLVLGGAALSSSGWGLQANAAPSAQSKGHLRGPSPSPTPTASGTSGGSTSPSPTASPTSADGSYRVPNSIDNTGGADVSNELANFINSVPNGSTISFAPGGVYRLDQTLELTDRTGLTLDGAGSVFTTKATNDGTRAQIRLVGGGSYQLKNLTIQGSSTAGGTQNAFVADLQWQHGLDLRGVSGIDVSNVTVTDVYGDCVYVGLGTGSSKDRWSTDVHIHDSTCKRNGRQGIAVTAGANVTVDHSNFSEIALMTFNIEPNAGAGGAKNVSFVDNQIGTGPRQQLLGVVGVGPVDGVTLSRNKLTGKPFTVLLESTNGVVRTDVVISDNTSDADLWITGGAAIVASGINGLTVTGNHQKLDGPNMAFVDVSSSCRVNVSGNSFAGGELEEREHTPGC